MGHYSSMGGECEMCPAGTYTADEGSSNCTACASGAFSAAGSSDCHGCDYWSDFSSGVTTARMVLMVIRRLPTRNKGT